MNDKKVNWRTEKRKRIKIANSYSEDTRTKVHPKCLLNVHRYRSYLIYKRTKTEKVSRWALTYLSCPPPLMIGSNRTRGLLRTYSAPIPTTDCIVFDAGTIMRENAFEGVMIVSSHVFGNTSFGPIKQITLCTPLVTQKQARCGMWKKSLHSPFQILGSRHSIKLQFAKQCPLTNGSRYSRMNQVKFVEDSL